MRTIAIFGTGSLASHVMAHLRTDVVATLASDNNPATWGGRFHGVPVVPPDELCRHRWDYLLVASMYADEIIDSLRSHGMPREKLVACVRREDAGTARTDEQDVLASLTVSRAAAASIDAETALANLSDICEALEAIGIRPWLTDGTLLGFYRDGTFIPHDKDTDLGVLIDERTDDLIPAVVARGFVLTRELGSVDVGLEYTFARRGVKTDLFFFYRNGATLWHGAWTGSGQKNLVKYVYDDFLPLREIEWMARRFLVPSNIEKYVVTKYGPTWNQPIKHWDWAFGPANHVKTDVWM